MSQENSTAGCPRCGCQTLRTVRERTGADEYRQRIECRKCHRFAGWTAGRPENPETPAAPRAGETAIPPAPGPSAWLYVSRRLDLDWAPNEPFWSGPAYSLGCRPPWFPPVVVHYRLTAGVFAWLLRAGEQLERRWHAGEVGRDQVDEYCRLMGPVIEFADRWIPREERRAAKPELPEDDWGPK